jgi:methylated-DNA-[protein]-cysteine S-methyltransferase
MVQIKQYFSGARSRLIVPYLLQEGTPFMRKVWEFMRRIPFGDTNTYADIAGSAGSPRACRAVGNACAANPLPFLVPCHRVVGKRGVGGFSAGTKWKEFLLSIETHGGRASRT